MLLIRNVFQARAVRKPCSVAAGLCFVAAMMGAHAAPEARAASPWVQSHKVETRLIVGAIPRGNGLDRFVGVEMRLAPNWKTYWRNPGDAGGIPPVFEIPLNGNVVRAEVLYPAPSRYIEPGIGTTFGYKRSVVFPIRIALRDANAPTRLALNVHFGVCEEICIPVSVSLSHTIRPQDFSVLPSGLRLALDQIPRPGPAGAISEVQGPAITRLEPRLEDADPHLMVHATGGAGKPADDLFPVNADDAIRLGVPVVQEEAKASPDTRVFKVPLLSDVSLEALRTQPLAFVVVGAGKATRQDVAIPETNMSRGGPAKAPKL